MISQNSQQPKLDYLFSELTSVKSHVQLKQQILLPPESQVKTWEEEIILYNKQKIEERQLLSWTSAKTDFQERLGISLGCMAEGFTTVGTGWQHWRGPYLHRIILQTSKGGWSRSEGQSGIPFTVSDLVMNGRILLPAREPEGIWAEVDNFFQMCGQLATHG